MSKENNIILMEEGAWMNSQLSIARHYGDINFCGFMYTIVNKRGMDLFECTAEANRLGRDKAIPAGEPADLVRMDFIPLYKKLGRDRFIEILQESKCAKADDVKKMMEAAAKDGKQEK